MEAPDSSSQTQHHHRHQTMLKSSLLLLISFCLVCGINGFGYTDPDVIYALEGDSIEIKCAFNLRMGDGHDSSSLSFEETCDDSSLKVYNSSQYVKVLTSNSTKLRLPNRRYSICNLTCQLPKYNVAYTKVFTGRPLDKVRDFRCRSQNWQNLVCNFTEMSNTIPISYDLSFTENETDYRALGTPERCDKDVPNRRRSCTIFSATNNSNEYFRHVGFFNFTLRSYFSHNESVFLTESFLVDFPGSVVPAAPTDFVVSQVTRSWATLSWKADKDLDYDVQVRSQYNATWETLSLDSTDRKLRQLKLEEVLAVPFCQYEVRMRVKTPEAPFEEDMWSRFVTQSFRTLSRTPDRPPRAPLGAFFMDPYDNLTIYWEALDAWEQNGPKLRYQIVSMKEDSISKPPPLLNDLSKTSAKLSELNVNDHSYTLSLVSTNDLGDSRNVTEIFVPRKADQLQVKFSLSRFYDEAQKSSLLQWQLTGRDVDLVESLTVFSCSVAVEAPKRCDGKLNFTTVSKDTRVFYIPESKEHVNYAVAASSSNSTTGMNWIDCFAHAANHIGKPSTIFITNNGVENNRLNVQWGVECPDIPVLQLFRIDFCKVRIFGTDDSPCLDHSTTITLSDTSIRAYRIEGLLPYTNYKVSLRMISTDGTLGPPVYTYETTLQTAPTPPRTLEARDVSNTSVTLSWKAPEFMNGRFERYEVFKRWNDSRGSTHGNALVTGNETSLVLTDLRPFMRYGVVVSACNDACSTSSNEVFVETRVGAPSEVPRITSYGSVIEWDEPKFPGGPLSFYQMLIEFQSGETRVFRIDGRRRRCQLSGQLCIEKKDTYKVYLRAGNLKEDWTDLELDENASLPCDLTEFSASPGEIYFLGNWSSSYIEHHCSVTVVFVAEFVLHLFVTLVIVGMMFFLFLVVLRKFRKISKLEAVLPEMIKHIVDESPDRSGGHYDSEKSLLGGSESSQQELVPKSESSDKYCEVNRGHVEEDSWLLQNSSSQQPLLEDVEKKVQIVASPKKTNEHQYLPMNKIVPKEPELVSLQIALQKLEMPNQTVPQRLEMPALIRPTPPAAEASKPKTGKYVTIERGITRSGYVGEVVQTPGRILEREAQVAKRPPANTYVQRGFVFKPPQSSQPSSPPPFSSGFSQPPNRLKLELSSMQQTEA